MAEELLSAFEPLLADLSEYLRTRPELRQHLAGAARAFASWIESPTVPVHLKHLSSVSSNRPDFQGESSQSASVTDRQTANSSHVKPLLTPSVAGGNYEQNREFVPLPLATVAARCRIKAAASGLVAKRSGAVTGLDYATEEANVRKLAEAIPDCGLWMFDPSGGVRSKAVWDDLSGGYIVCACAAELLRAWAAGGFELALGQDVLLLAAEAQSMLLYAVADVGWVSRDHEQVQLFVHVRELGKQFQIYVPRFLRREDPAEPSNWPDLHHRLKAAISKFHPGGQAVAVGDPIKIRLKAVGNLKFKLKKLAEDPAKLPEEWHRVLELIDQAVAAGVTASDPDLVEGFQLIYDQIPNNLPVSCVVERILRTIESQRVAPEWRSEPSDDSTELSEQSLKTVRGKELLVIGGMKNIEYLAALKNRLKLTEVRWVNSIEVGGLAAASALVSRPEVAALIVTTRWASHDFEELQRTCSKLDKPYLSAHAEETVVEIANRLLASVEDRTSSRGIEGFAAGL
jgi:hypothetical protein